MVYLHGGPGGRSYPRFRQYFDPAFYRIVLFDQRGTGHSTPSECTEENTTWHLVADLEKIRKYLRIPKWLVMGNSWGSLLALAYAQRHPAPVAGLFIRGVFLGQQQEIDWLFREGGASRVFPEAWEAFVGILRPEERDRPLEAYYQRLHFSNPAIRREAALAFMCWEMHCSLLNPDAAWIRESVESRIGVSWALLETHYFQHHCFLPSEMHLLTNIDRLRSIPAVIGQGCYDMVCPPSTAYQLHKAWPEAIFDVVPDAGHTSLDPSTCDHIVCTTDQFRDLPF